MDGGAGAAAAAAFSQGLYGCTAVAMAFVNKSVLVHGFKETNVMLFMQMVAAAASIYLLRAWGAITFAPLSLQRARALAPISVFYSGNTAFALASLDGMSVPMYTVIKRMTPAIIIAYHATRGSLPSRPILVSVSVILVGTTLAGIGDLAFDPKAYAMGLTSCALQAAYLITVQGSAVGLSSWELLLYNSLLSLPILLSISAADGEGVRASISLPRLFANERGFAVAFVSTLFLGVLLNFSIFLCTRLNSALTTTIVGSIKGVATTVLGFFLVGGAGVVTPVQGAGIFLNVLGGCWYTIVEWREKETARKEKEAKRIDGAGGVAAAAAPASGSAEEGGAGEGTEMEAMVGGTAGVVASKQLAGKKAIE